MAYQKVPERASFEQKPGQEGVFKSERELVYTIDWEGGKMDASFVVSERGTVYIHELSENEFLKWKYKTDGEVTDLSNCLCLTFNVGKVDIKLFSVRNENKEEPCPT